MTGYAIAEFGNNRLISTIQCKYFYVHTSVINDTRVVQAVRTGVKIRQFRTAVPYGRTKRVMGPGRPYVRAVQKLVMSSFLTVRTGNGHRLKLLRCVTAAYYITVLRRVPVFFSNES